MEAQPALTAEQLRRFRGALDALAPGARIGIAVSGGPDSLALLLLARACRPDFIAAATVDHGLRAEAAAEADMVARTCAGFGIPHATLGITVEDDPAGVQAAARRARYAALIAWAGRQRLAFIATAHHADDQAETLLMRLARGSGLGGLAGVRRARPLAGTKITLIRPLLDWTKAELEEVVAGAGIVPARDLSNSDPRYDRTRARTLLANGWPDSRRVAASAHHLSEAEEALGWAADRLAGERLVFGRDDVTLDVSGLPRELRRRLVLAAFAGVAPEAKLRGDAVDRLLDALGHGTITTLAGFRCDPGPPWRVARAAARRRV
jgi:tRNA(Ile)-lysidine synthase